MTPSQLSRNNISAILAAAEFAVRAHAKQPRKYTGEPYAVHPLAVARLVTGAGASADAIVAALLHDVLEDCPQVKPSEIEKRFGAPVMHLVMEVTEVSHPDDGNRAVRKALDAEHYAKASPEGQTIKVADMIDNMRTIVMSDPTFAKLFMLEKRDLLARFTRAEPRLYDQAKCLVDEYFAGEAARGKAA
jgi:(p)ppGpp synthase/HD superfamily hydrolase